MSILPTFPRQLKPSVLTVLRHETQQSIIHYKGLVNGHTKVNLGHITKTIAMTPFFHMGRDKHLNIQNQLFDIILYAIHSCVAIRSLLIVASNV